MPPPSCKKMIRTARSPRQPDTPTPRHPDMTPPTPDTSSASCWPKRCSSAFQRPTGSYICELWVRSYIFLFCYEKHHICLCWSGGFKCAVVSSLRGSGVRWPPRAFDELRPCVRGWAQMTSPPTPFICYVSVFVPMKLASYRCLQSLVCVTSMRLPFERVTSINMYAFAYL